MNWQMLYFHDANGTARAGSEVDLISAIRNGAQIRLSTWLSDDYQFVCEPSAIFVKNDNVYAQHAHFGGDWVPTDVTLLDFASPFTMITQNFCTSGRIVTLYTNDGANGRRETRREVHMASLKWFASR
jgi:hypothetical protein